MARKFQSTLPAREATKDNVSNPDIALFQSTLPAREATRGILSWSSILTISIHASREGSDRRCIKGLRKADISIHASREGSDPSGHGYPRPLWHFNPRFPRGKRRFSLLILYDSCNFNPRFPRGKRHFTDANKRIAFIISIHASREGSDHNAEHERFGHKHISIHASREGSDIVF